MTAFIYYPVRPPGRVARLRGKWRMMWGMCPGCNSDAPEIDRCVVCADTRQVDWPPTFAVRAQRWQRFTCNHYFEDVNKEWEPRTMQEAVLNLHYTGVGCKICKARAWLGAPHWVEHLRRTGRLRN